ncbi:MAG TPA: glycosyltransferase family 4 protein [Geminicoccaceae bacterium]|jgi:glycosyltransferase involved in cell wall biosynthesis|nr:glycosyltransferase family 4 protein [Geminicoccaceae bacterium]
MKVVVLGSYAPSLIRFRGCLIEDMVAAGHTVVGCAPGSDAGVASALAARGAAYQPVPLRRTGLNPLLDAWSVLRLARLLRQLRPDLLFAYTAKPVIYGALAARRAGVPAMFALISGLGYAFVEGRGLARRVMRHGISALYRASLRHADGVFFQNPDDLEDFRRLAIICDRHNAIRVNGSGVDTDHYEFSAPTLEPPTFLLIARLLADKGIYEFVEAARQLRSRHRDTRFRLLGPLDTNPAAISTSDLERWRPEGVIEYLGEVEDVRPHLRDTTAFVLPSAYREGVPRTLLEALSTGRAIITTDTPGCRETVLPGENGFLVPPRDAAALAGAMERFVVEPDLAVDFGRRSRALAEERFEVRKVNAVMLQAMGLR